MKKKTWYLSCAVVIPHPQKKTYYRRIRSQPGWIFFGGRLRASGLFLRVHPSPKKVHSPPCFFLEGCLDSAKFWKIFCYICGPNGGGGRLFRRCQILEDFRLAIKRGDGFQYFFFIGHGVMRHSGWYLYVNFH